MRKEGTPPGKLSEADLAKRGRELLLGGPSAMEGLEVLGENMEDSHRKQVILKPREGYLAYRQMLHYYAMKNLIDYMAATPGATLATMNRELAGTRERNWVNLGGQLAPEQDVQRLLGEIKAGTLKTWPEIHAAYDALWKDYPLAKRKHAFATLMDLLGVKSLTPQVWNANLDEVILDQEYVRDQVYVTRKKDYEDPFRRTTFRNADEMKSVVGTAEDNSFVKQVRQDTETFRVLVETVRKRG